MNVTIVGAGDTPTESRFAVGNDEAIHKVVTTLRTLINDPSKADTRPKFEKELEKMEARTPDEVTEKMGIVSRQLRPDKTSYELGLTAALRAVQSARAYDPHFTTDQIDVIGFGSSTPDHEYPGGDAYVHEMLGLTQCEGITVSGACCSAIEAFTVVYRAMKDNPEMRYGLVVVGEVAGSANNANENEDALLWGDGGGALVVKSDPFGDPKLGVLNVYGRLYTGKYEDKGRMYDMTSSEGQGVHPMHRNWRLNGSMNGHGHDIYEIVVRPLAKDGRDWLERKGFEIGPNDQLYPHNGSLKMINSHGKRMGFAPEQIHNRIRDRANQSCVSCVSTYAHELVSGNVHSDQLLIFDVFGAGLKHWLMAYRAA